MTTVTDADREAAAAIAVLPEMRDLILAGRADHHAEAFARHREAAEARATAAEAREAALVAENTAMKEALAMAVAEMSRARGRLEIIAGCNEDRTIAAALGSTCDHVRRTCFPA